MTRKRRIGFIVSALALFIIIVVILNITFKPKSGGEVETAVARKDTLVSRVSATGNLKAQAQVNIQAQVMGRVDGLYVKEGDAVKAGQLLCLLDQTQYRAALTLARTNFEQQGRLLTRADTLFAKKLIAQEEYERVRTSCDVARAQLEQAQDQFDKTRIVSPISGTVVKVNIEAGETVIIGTMNNLGTVMMIVADLSKMLALVDVDESDIPQIRLGQQATVRLDALPDSVFGGTVTKIGYMPIQSTSLTANATGGQQTTADFEVEVALASSADVLRPGMTVSSEITTARQGDVLVVPIQAVGRRKIKGKVTQSVFVVDKGSARLQPVETGSSSDTDIEIRVGLKPGDMVVSGPYKVLSKLTDGARVATHGIKPGADSAGTRRPRARMLMRLGR